MQSRRGIGPPAFPAPFFFREAIFLHSWGTSRREIADGRLLKLFENRIRKRHSIWCWMAISFEPPSGRRLIKMRTYATLLQIVMGCTLLPSCGHAEGIDTEHLFGFTIGTDVGEAGEREFQN